MKPPTLSSSTAAALSITYTILYVLPFYLHPTTRPAPTLSRDAPIVIRTRIQLVSLSVAVCTLTTYYILSQQIHLSPGAVTHSLGFYPITLTSIINPLLLTSILFLGPLFETLIVPINNNNNNHHHHYNLRNLFSSSSTTLFSPSWTTYRNYLAAPLTEELLFRSLLLALHLHSSSSSPARLIFATPLYFGIAHIHHFYEFRLTHPSVPPLPALLRSLVQFAYTTVFGWYASFLYLRTGGVWGVVVVHAFCNWMGLPRVWGRVGVVGGMVRGEEGEDDDDSDDDEGDENDNGQARGKGRGTSSAASGELGMGWTVAYYVCLVGGAVAWWKLKWVLTECEGALIDFR